MQQLPKNVIRASVAAFVAALITGAPAAHAQSTQPPADLGITITDNPDPVETNASFQYQYEVRNFSGLNFAYGVSAIFDIPHHVALPGGPPGGCYQPAGDKLVCEMGHIEPGGVRSRSIPVKHLLNGPIQFQGTVLSGVQSDPVPGNNTDFETTTVTGQQAPSWTVQVNRVGHGTVRGHGISCGVDFNPGLDCTEPFSEGGTATLRANESRDFVGWAGDCAFAGTNPVCSLPVTGNMDVTAHFLDTPQAPPIASVQTSGGGKLGSIFKFDTSGTANATSTVVKFNPPGPSRGLGDFIVPPGNTTTGVRLNSPGEYKVSVTATNPNGTSTDTTLLQVDRGKGFLGKPPPDVAFSVSDPAKLRPGLPVTDPCAINGQLVVGAVEARGCFSHAVDPDHLPAAERPVANEWWTLNQIFAKDDTVCLNQDELPARCAELAAVQGLEVYYSQDVMMMNGMKVDPAPGAAVVFFPAIGKVVSSNAKITFTGPDIPAFPAHNGALNLNVGIDDASVTRKPIPLFTFNASQLPDIGGFKIDGQMSIALAQEGARRFSELAVNMTLPEEFATSADTRPSGAVKLQATNDEGIILSNLDLSVPEAFLGGVRLSKLGFTYKHFGEATQGCARKWWKATAEIYIIPAGDEDGAGLSLAPPPERNGIAFCAGGFHSGGGIFTFGEPIPPPQIFPGVFLDSIGFNMQLKDPTVFSGEASVTAAKIVKATGGLLVAFARPDAPYVIKAEDGGDTMAPLAGTRLEKTSFAVGGSVGMKLPGEDNVLNLGNATLLYEYPHYVKADGLARINTFLYTLEASGGFEANALTRRFDAFARGQVCLAGGITIEGVGACVAGEGRASSKGTSACLIIIDDGFEPGVGYAWGDTLPHIFNGITDGCKPSKYWEQNIRGARIAAQRLLLVREAGPPAPVRGGAGTGPIAFTVKPGDTTKNVELHGMGGAPAVRIEAPNGEISTTVPNEMQVGDHIQNLAWEEHDYTWVSVTDGEPGEYLVTPLNGSVPVKGMFETRPTPDEGITASVTASRGGEREQLLRYDVGEDPGQKVTFVERGDGIWNEIGTATKGKGIIPFESGLAAEGEREIIAQYEVGGIPGPIEVLDDYDAPPPPTAGQTDGVKVKRKGRKLTIKWKKTVDAANYGVVVTQENGIQKSKTVSAKKRTLKVRGISPIEAGTVSVSGIGPLGDVGSEDTGTFKAIKKKPDRRVPYSKLGKGGPKL